MALSIVITATTGKSVTASGIGTETRELREKRMKAFWTAPDNVVIYPVGKLLAQPLGPNGTTLAAYLIADVEGITLTSIPIEGKEYPLAEATTISLGNVAEWGCPTCKSAHGSGVRPSPAVTEKGLASNLFYYNPASRSLFTISDTCMADYCKALGFAGNIKLPSEVKASKAKMALTPKVVTA